MRTSPASASENKSYHKHDQPDKLKSKTGTLTKVLRVMIPLSDNIPSRSVPVVNYALIGICLVVFLAQVGESPEAPSLVERFGMIPSRITDPEKPVDIVVGVQRVMTPRGIQYQEVRRPAAPPAVPAVLTLLTCIFLHGGWMHFLGNMLFLHIFGDNVEDRFGHIGYLAFYALCGTLASLAHLWSAPGSTIPTVGASGAIAGVMGAYFVWYPRAHVRAIVPIFFFLHLVEVPAPIFLGVWFLLQFFQGTMSIDGTEAAGVAWWAHIGGFVCGLLIAKLMGRTRVLRPANTVRRRPFHGNYTYRDIRRGPW